MRIEEIAKESLHPSIHSNDIYCLSTKTYKEFYINHVTVTIIYIVIVLIVQTRKSKMIEMLTFPRLHVINNIAKV